MKRIQIAFLLLVLLPSALHAADPLLGRLFFTPAQRNTLDAGKQLDLPKKAGPTVRGPRSLTVNGIVTRSDGESTVWVNGGAAGIKRRGSATISATPSDSATARVQTSGTSARLRVGQTLDRSTGKVQELYESKPRSAEPVAPGPSPTATSNDSAGGSADPGKPPGQDSEAPAR
jgi:hypothetical protein